MLKSTNGLLCPGDILSYRLRIPRGKPKSSTIASLLDPSTPDKKLNSAQMNYATIDNKILCVVATLREFRSMLFGVERHIYTDHKNILSVGNSSEHRLRWISYVDNNGPTLQYVEGPHNVIADTLSRLSHQKQSLWQQYHH